MRLARSQVMMHEYLSGRHGEKELVVGEEREASDGLILDAVWKRVGLSDNYKYGQQDGYLPRTSSHLSHVGLSACGMACLWIDP